MAIRLLSSGRMFGRFKIAGECDGHPIYVGHKPPREEVAGPADDGSGIHINKDAFSVLMSSPRGSDYLERVCQQVIKNGPGHDDTLVRPNFDPEVIRYLETQGYFE